MIFAQTMDKMTLFPLRFVDAIYSIDCVNWNVLLVKTELLYVRDHDPAQTLYRFWHDPHEWIGLSHVGAIFIISPKSKVLQ